MTSFLQSMRDGGPLGIMASMASTNLQQTANRKLYEAATQTGLRLPATDCSNPWLEQHRCHKRFCSLAELLVGAILSSADMSLLKSPLTSASHQSYQATATPQPQPQPQSQLSRTSSAPLGAFRPRLLVGPVGPRL